MVCSDLSEGILDFLSKIDESSNDAERIFGSIRSAAASFAEKTGLGRVVLSVSADPSGVEPDGISGETEFYTSPVGYEDSSISESLVSGMSGSFTVTVMPAKGTEWSTEEKTLIAAFAKSCCMACSNAHYAELIRESGFIDRLTGAAIPTDL